MEAVSVHLGGSAPIHAIATKQGIVRSFPGLACVGSNYFNYGVSRFVLKEDASSFLHHGKAFDWQFHVRRQGRRARLLLECRLC